MLNKNISGFMMAVLSLVIFVSIPGKSLAQGRLPPKLFDAVKEEINNQPTSKDNLQERYHVLRTLSGILLQETGKDNFDKVFPPDKNDKIMALSEAGNFKEAGERIDSALLGLCRLGENTWLADIRKVNFVSLDGVKVVGYLFMPLKPAKAAFIFGHGGFGYKENWIDLMREVSGKANVYALAIDFQGCGESRGYTKWQGRIRDFSYAIDYLEKEFGLTKFAVGGHSGGGAYPAACAAIDDVRISALTLWDCPFDFYDMHIVEGAVDPGGNPAPLVERTYLANKDKILVPTEVFKFRDIPGHLNEIYEEIDATLKNYRHPAKMLGEAQKKRRLAVLHIIAEDVLKPIGANRMGETYFLPFEETQGSRKRFLNRPLAFFASGLFNRPQGAWKEWEADLFEPKKFVIIENTTHGFEPPGRNQAIEETISWLKLYLVN